LYQISNDFDKALIFLKLSYYLILKVNKNMSGKTNAIYDFGAESSYDLYPCKFWTG